jgi:outer membrane biogenesis lipoprotein LolB
VGRPVKTRIKPPAAWLARGSAWLVLLLLLASCAGRLPVLVPPPAGVDAVAGYASASIEGEEMALKGKFAFLFRHPGAGRVDVSDPFGSTLYFLLFDKDTAYLVVPRKKTYAEEKPETLMGRFLGFSLQPDEVIRLLSGDWPEGRGAVEEPAWRLVRDESGRVGGGERNGFRFEILEFFPGAGVPRTLVFSAPGTSGRIRLLTVRFNPAPRPEALEADFLKSFRRRSWEEIQEILKNED